MKAFDMSVDSSAQNGSIMHHLEDTILSKMKRFIVAILLTDRSK